MSRIAVIDFETTGLSPAQGDRATEVAIVLLEDGGQVVGRFQSLMNAGVRIPAFIESLTGISNAMVAAAPPAAEVMAEAAGFVGDAPMAAHNASFDRRFWLAELQRLGRLWGGGVAGSNAMPAAANAPFACTMLLARRLYPDAPSHKLGALAQLHHLPSAGRAHRALADAEVAASLLTRIQADLCERFAVEQADHALLMKVQACQRHAMPTVVRRYLQAA